MTNAPRETELFRQLVASGVSEPQAIDTVQALDRMLGSEAVAPDPANDPFLNDIRAKALGGRHTIELTPDEMKALANPDAAKGRG